MSIQEIIDSGKRFKSFEYNDDGNIEAGPEVDSNTYANLLTAHFIEISLSLVGFPKHKLPNPVTLRAIRKSIMERFSNLSPFEIMKAFEAAINGDFDAELRHFNELSLLYIINVLKPYRRWKIKVERSISKSHEEPKKLERSPSEMLSMSNESKKQWIKDLYIKYLELGNFEINPIRKTDFQYLWYNGLIKLTEEQVEVIRVEAKHKAVQKKKFNARHISELMEGTYKVDASDGDYKFYWRSCAVVKTFENWKRENLTPDAIHEALNQYCYIDFQILKQIHEAKND